MAGAFSDYGIDNIFKLAGKSEEGQMVGFLRPSGKEFQLLLRIFTVYS